MSAGVRKVGDVLATVIIAYFVVSTFAGWRQYASLGLGGVDSPLRIVQTVLEIAALLWIGFGTSRQAPLFSILAIGALAPAPVLYFTGQIRFSFVSALAHAVMAIVVALRWWESWEERRSRA